MRPLPCLLAWAPVLLLHVVCCKNLNSFAGPYIAFAHRFDVCPSDGTIVIRGRNTHFNPAKPKEKQRIWGNATVDKQFDDSWWIHVNLAVRSNNEWKENAFIFDFPGYGCSALREHIPTVFHVLTTLAPELSDKKKPCAFPPGQYDFENQSISWDFPKFKVIPYGHYRFTVTVGKTTRAVKMCLEVDCEAIPKSF